jgi:endonuclease G, mitochondrial
MRRHLPLLRGGPGDGRIPSVEHATAIPLLGIVKTPDAFWKVVIRGGTGKERAIAWLVPNTPEAKRSELDKYIVSLAKLEQMTGERFPVPAWLREEKPETSWLVPVGCDKS